MVGVVMRLYYYYLTVSFDIENIYSNVCTNDFIDIIKSMCSQQNHGERILNELVKITHTFLKQNYFKFQISFYVK